MSNELNVAEADLRKRYRGIVVGSLKEPSGKGRYAHKRTVTLECPKCKHRFQSATSDIFIRCCPKDGQQIQPEQQKKTVKRAVKRRVRKAVK